MKVLLTGGAGALGSRVGPYLANQGHDVTLLDQRECESDLPSILCDISDQEALLDAVKDHEVVVHAASLHGIHIPQKSERDFLTVNVLGTHSVLEAVRKAGTKRLIYTSSTSVYGASSKAVKDTAWYIDENSPFEPIDINDISKVQTEYLIQFYRRHYNLDCLILRFGRFFEEEWVNTNLTKLYGGVDLNDVAHAIHQAIIATDLQDNTFCISSLTPFTKDDLKDLIQRPDEVIEKYYPGAKELFQQVGRELPKFVHRIVDSTRAVQQLHYNPKYNFSEFLEEFQRRQINEGMIAR